MHTRYYTKSLLLFVLLYVCCAWPGSAQQKVYYTGHSLINLDIPYQTRQLLDAQGVESSYRHHINNGASIKLNWMDTLFNPNPIWTPSLGRDVEYGTNHLRALKSPFDRLVMTEAIPLLNYPVDTSVKYFSKFVRLAATSNQEIETFIYATWEHGVSQSSDWIDQVRALVPRWEKIRMMTEMQTGNEKIYIIPGNIAMIKLHEMLEEGAIGSLQRIEQLFEPDGVHPNFNGRYFMACLFAAVIFDIDPRGGPIVKAGPYTDEMVVQEKVVREALQRIAFEAACSYKWSDYSNEACTLGAKETEGKQASTAIHPILYSGAVWFHGEKRFIRIFDLQGRLYKYLPHGAQVEVTELPKGIYLLSWYEMVGNQPQYWKIVKHY